MRGGLGVDLLLLQLEGGPAFLGCTPEKLFQIAPSADGGARLSTEAIAGTRGRGWGSGCTSSGGAAPPRSRPRATRGRRRPTRDRARPVARKALRGARRPRGY